MKLIQDKNSNIDQFTLSELFALWKTHCKHKIFVNHPISLTIFYPNTNIYFEKKPSYIEIIAEDNFTIYKPITGYGHIESYKSSMPVYNILACQRKSWNANQTKLYDWHYCYFVREIEKKFKKRRNLINRAKKEKLEIKDSLPKQTEIKMLMKKWLAQKQYQREEEKIIARSNIEIQWNFYLEKIQHIKDIKIPIYIKSLYIKNKLIGISSAIKTGPEFIILFEISLYKEHPPAASFLFYNMVKEAKYRNSYFINTLGHDNIRNLIKNKELYKPDFLIPLYKSQINNL